MRPTTRPVAREVLRLLAFLGATLVVGSLILLAAGCKSWHAEAEIRLRNGSRVACTKGIGFSNKTVRCYSPADNLNTPYTDFEWDFVLGYSTR